MTDPNGEITFIIFSCCSRINRNIVKINDSSECPMAVIHGVPEIVIKNEPTARSSDEYYAMDAAPMPCEVDEQQPLQSGYDCDRNYYQNAFFHGFQSNSIDLSIEYKPFIDESKYGGANIGEAESHNEFAAANNQSDQGLLVECQYRRRRAPGKHKKSLKSIKTEIRHSGNRNAEQVSEMTFECHLCKKLLSTKHYIKQHIIKVHTGIKLFQCPYQSCLKSFAWKSSFKAHVNFVHLGVKRFQCQCLMRFSTENYLKKHIKKIHTGSFQCPFQSCSLKFAVRRRLKGHIKLVHNGVKPFPCTYPTCQQTFAQELHVRRHLRRFHLRKQLASERSGSMSLLQS